MAPGLLFDLQPYAVHDGPGIRTLVFMKGCPLACAWCCNPESQAFKVELRQVPEHCLGCHRCLAACPSAALVATEGAPAPDWAACASCASLACTTVCPGGALVAVGRPVHAEAVVEEVARDADFFRNSGGGVTFSGGEPLAQPAFLEAMLRACRERGIATAVETCGHAPLQDVQACEPLVDLFLYDLKVMDPERHAALTGQDNRRILANLQWLAAHAPEKVVIRHAVIPGLNDDPADHEALADGMLSLGLKRLDLEPYHPLGEPKYEGLGRCRSCTPDAQALDEARLAALVAYFNGRGLSCEVA